MQRLNKYSFCVNFAKCQFTPSHIIEFLGCRLEKNIVHPGPKFGALFDEIDPNNPEKTTKLLEKYTSDELKVPGGFMFPLCLAVMASRQGTHVTIFLETYSNKKKVGAMRALQKVAILSSKKLTGCQ
jgi:hypothetical protein